MTETRPDRAGPQETTRSQRGFTRRKLALTAAWSTPVVLASVTTPALASSTPKAATPTLTLSAPHAVAPATLFDVTATLTSDGVTKLAGSTVTLTVQSPLNTAGVRVRATASDGTAKFQVLSANNSGVYTITATSSAPALSTTTQVTVTSSSIYTSTGGREFVNQHVLVGEISQVAVGGGYWAMLGQDGVVSRGNSAGTWNQIAGPSLGIKSFAVYPPNANWVIGAGNDGFGYGSYRGAAFTRIPGAAAIEQVAVSHSYWIARDAGGNVYTTSETTSPWELISAPVPARTIHAWYGSGQYIMMIGTDGRVYNSVGRKPFTLQSDSGANLTFAEIDSGTGWGVGRTTGGAVYRFSSSKWNAWERITAPVPIQQIAVYEANGKWVHALGVDGNGYWSEDGDAFVRISGASGIKKVSLAGNMWSALTHDGTYYLARTGRAYAQVTGAARIADFATYEFSGSYTIAVAPR